MKWLRIKLESIELIINTRKWTGAPFKYWMKERHSVLKEILELQLLEFEH